MQGIISYKFKNEKNFHKVKIEGESITLKDLKQKIAEKK